MILSVKQEEIPVLFLLKKFLQIITVTAPIIAMVIIIIIITEAILLYVKSS